MHTVDVPGLDQRLRASGRRRPCRRAAGSSRTPPASAVSSFELGDGARGRTPRPSGWPAGSRPRSRRRRASRAARRLRSLSSTVSEMPSNCAPSRSVVSKISTGGRGPAHVRSVDMLDPVLVAVDLAADGVARTPAAIAVVIGPGHGISRSSTEFTARTSAAVPHTNISSRDVEVAAGEVAERAPRSRGRGRSSSPSPG